jgi:hypothetical protein
MIAGRVDQLMRRRSVIVRMTPEGERLGTAVRIDNDPFELARQVALWGESPEVVLEATYGWYWAADVLADAGANVHLAHPLGVKGVAYPQGEERVRCSRPGRPAADGQAARGLGRPAEVRGPREQVRVPLQAGGAADRAQGAGAFHAG